MFQRIKNKLVTLMCIHFVVPRTNSEHRLSTVIIPACSLQLICLHLVPGTGAAAVTVNKVVDTGESEPLS